MDIYVVTSEQSYACNFSVIGVALTMEDAQAMAGGGEWRILDGGDAVPANDIYNDEHIYRFTVDHHGAPIGLPYVPPGV